MVKSVAYGPEFLRKGEREERKGRKERREQGSRGKAGRKRQTGQDRQADRQVGKGF